MIIENGTIEFKQKTPGTIDPETGYPSKATEVEWSEPIPCQYIPYSRQLLLRTGSGERITKATYKVLVEEQPLPDSEQVRLTDDRTGASLGEFSLLAPPALLEAVCEIKILL